ncbi:MAG: transcriptional repressor [Lentimicrobiaceae bacterium]|nr:transcriptional repressor [Lentimicrobiaceae bacterium]
MKTILVDIRKKLSEKGLKVTPQRIAVLEAVHKLNNHPTADNIIEYIHRSNPNIASGTVYKVLDTLVENHLIRKVRTYGDAMRYDGIMAPHHHIYCSGSNVIEDYADPELDKLLNEYFTSGKLAGFEIEEIVLQIRGTFINH